MKDAIYIVILWFVYSFTIHSFLHALLPSSLPYFLTSLIHLFIHYLTP
jgi:hypothetical protein